jgi:hypothetical protein
MPCVLHVLDADKLMQSLGKRTAKFIQWLRLPDDWDLLYILFIWRILYGGVETAIGHYPYAVAAGAAESGDRR